ncbi:unnamed protein product [Lactuca virosa]|uniref:Uncharacterized protein n=1 Tax=Lactuca virosa TaxID=75947 RepID=A0AAU9PPE6_9ASTR|nr:unnamed protein product [Lactuca virosa]
MGPFVWVLIPLNKGRPNPFVFGSFNRVASIDISSHRKIFLPIAISCRRLSPPYRPVAALSASPLTTPAAAASSGNTLNVGLVSPGALVPRSDSKIRLTKLQKENGENVINQTELGQFQLSVSAPHSLDLLLYLPIKPLSLFYFTNFESITNEEQVT